MKTLVFVSHKGGVGRTTVSGNVAAALAGQGLQTAWVTTAEGDWEQVENLTVFGCDAESLRLAVNDAQASVADGVVVVDMPACDTGANWWTGDGDVIVVTDGEASSLYAALEAARVWNEAKHPPVGFVLARTATDAAEEVGKRFRQVVARFASLQVAQIGAVPESAESATLANLGRFCKGKPAQSYATMAKRLSAGQTSAPDKPAVLDSLRGRREQFKAA